MIRNVSWVLLAMVGWAACGCNRPHDAVPTGYGFMGRPVTLAVAPVHDLTGTGQLDALAFTDIFAGELAQVPQISVVPVNQTLAVMYGQGWRSLSSPEQALQLARLLRADGLVALAVSEYDPYDPPRLGLIAEVYLLPPREPTVGLAGEDVGRSPAPLASQPVAGASGPTRLVQRVYEAARKGEQEQIRRYAAQRDPPGKHDWSEYLRSQKQFLRYCSWRTVLELTGAATAAEGEPD
jgi:hypothetical protein